MIRTNRSIRIIGNVVMVLANCTSMFAQEITPHSDTVYTRSITSLTKPDTVLSLLLADSRRSVANYCWKDSGDRGQIASYLSTNDSLFTQNWEIENVHEKFGNVPNDTNDILIVLRTGEEKFHYGYAGELFWGYGPRWGRIHRGLDTKLNIGDSIVAAFNGIVRFSSFDDGGYGNCVVVRHFNGLETLYAHLSKLLVSPGDLVCSGEVIGLAGVTGRSNGPHLHFETRYHGFSFDPLLFFTKDSFQLRNDTLVLGRKNFFYETEKGISSVTIKHRVKAGETLTSIAKKHRSSVRKLVRLNGITNPNKLKIGQTLRIKK